MFFVEIGRFFTLHFFDWIFRSVAAMDQTNTMSSMKISILNIVLSLK